MPGMKKCTFTNHPYNTLRNRFSSILTDLGFDLLNRCVSFFVFFFHFQPIYQYSTLCSHFFCGVHFLIFHHIIIPTLFIQSLLFHLNWWWLWSSECGFFFVFIMLCQPFLQHGYKLLHSKINVCFYWLLFNNCSWLLLVLFHMLQVSCTSRCIIIQIVCWELMLAITKCYTSRQFYRNTVWLNENFWKVFTLHIGFLSHCVIGLRFFL